MDTKKESRLTENVAIIFIMSIFIVVVLNISFCLLKNKEEVKLGIKQIKNEINSFVISVKSEISTFGTPYCELSQNISGLG